MNALSQKKVLLDLVKKILPDKRIPMLIIDQNPIFADRKKIEARLAGIYGFSIFGSDHTYLLDKNKKIDYSVLNSFLKKNFLIKKFLIFGFTSLVYKFLIENIDQGKISILFIMLF